MVELQGYSCTIIDLFGDNRSLCFCALTSVGALFYFRGFIMQKFKYLFKEKEVITNLNELNKLGEDGWELVGITDEQSNNAIFKKTICSYNDNYDKVAIEDRVEFKIFENNDIAVVFQGVERREFLFGNEGFVVRFIVQNKTKQAIEVYALNVRVNGLPLEKKEPLASNIYAGKRRLAYFKLDIPKLIANNIYSISDMKLLEFQIFYETFNEDFNNTSENIKITPFEF